MERGGGLSFLNESCAANVIRDCVRRQQLQRDQPVKPRIPRLVDDTHAAFAELLEDFVMRKRSAEHSGPRWRLSHVSQQATATT